MNVDTDDPACKMTSLATSHQDVCVLVGTDLTITARVTAHGTLPWVLAGANALTITINGVLEVSSTLEHPGAACDRACADPPRRS